MIVGDDEAQGNEATIKPLREAAEQHRVAFDDLAGTVGEWILGPDSE